MKNYIKLAAIVVIFIAGSAVESYAGSDFIYRDAVLQQQRQNIKNQRAHNFYMQNEIRKANNQREAMIRLQKKQMRQMEMIYIQNKIREN